jgi:hypothetical protein
MEEARQRAEQSSTAYRQEAASENAPQISPASSRNDFLEQWYKAKYGRYSPMEEARQKAGRGR